MPQVLGQMGKRFLKPQLRPKSKMPEFGYSFRGYDPLLHVKASGREIDVSPKATIEVCTAVRGLTLPKARKLLEDVIVMKAAVPFRKYKKEAAHRSEIQDFPSGAYPAKAASKVLAILENLQANAEFKGLDTERLKIIHAAAHGGRKLRRYVPRAFGKSSPSFNILVHIELVGKEG